MFGLYLIRVISTIYIINVLLLVLISFLDTARAQTASQSPFHSNYCDHTYIPKHLDPTIKCTTLGLVRGVKFDFYLKESNTTKNDEQQSVYAYLGIPYAENPENLLRFKKPVPKRPWHNADNMIYNATMLPNSCYQMIIDFFNTSGEKIWTPITPMSEDCLYLNIWIPTKRVSSEPLAVMVWFYGGGFTSGSSTLRLYDGSILAATNNVIVVSMEYRVESLGFLYLGTEDAPGNQGLYDQLLALEFIHKNIQYFGGDNQRITLFGESAGAVSVGLHLLSPKSRHLFNNAILQSSGASAKWAVLNQRIAKFRSEKFLDVLTNYIYGRYSNGPTNGGIDPEYEAIPPICQKPMLTIQDKFACVQKYPVLNQIHFRSSWALESYNGGPVGYTFVPTIDNDFVPYDPELMLTDKNYKKCPLLLGVNSDEGSYFIIYVPHGNMPLDSLPYVDYKTFKNAMKEYFRFLPSYPTERPPMVLESILQTYTPWGDFNNTVKNAIQLSMAVGDYHFTCPTVYLADIYAQAEIPVYFYHFTLRASVSPWHQWMGVLHADEIMFVFGEPLNITDELQYTNEEIQTSKKMMTYWTNFAKYSNPNQRHESKWANDWRLYKWPSREHIILNTTLQPPGHGQAIRAEYCSFWLDYIPKLMLVTSNVSDDEKLWKQEFREWQSRYQQWDYHYTQYNSLLDKNKQRLSKCLT
ncbi:unnamed protein product [Didymodactylos carnosus]|uniref:Carboxylic ester hydrolase n=1 Tax=Didymodactylos carnosus TaxID=1234261 RepID=A0A813RAD7_9BILA|nr:unnamed protein product [Didymodactylos carnosus]CAF0780795.1 unnamed protein product [Didymodactylos carnosus]CAF3499987.1 unnamed protein product [Didymodactylos carnosus]CAF3563989.1 unnamed protein product [Didymodactylos carnosus]